MEGGSWSGGQVCLTLGCLTPTGISRTKEWNSCEFEVRSSVMRRAGIARQV